MQVERREGHVRRAQEVPRALVAAGVLVGTGWLATEDIPVTEKQLFARINGLPGWLEPLMWLPMQLGSLFGPFVAGALAWWRWRQWRPAVGSVMVGVLSWQLAKVVKDHVKRGRPLDVLDQVIRRMGTPKDGLGFVSGHSAVAFSVVTALSPYLSRPARVAAFGLALLVGVARIHVGAHLPLDVVGGASLGCLIGYLWRTAIGVPGPDGALPDSPTLQASGEVWPLHGVSR